MTAVIRWEDPPPHGNTGQKRGDSKYVALAAALRSHPREWAVVAEGLKHGSAGSLASRIKRGTGAFTPRGAYEARCVAAAGSDDAKVYARYIGEVKP